MRTEPLISIFLSFYNSDCRFNSLFFCIFLNHFEPLSLLYCDLHIRYGNLKGLRGIIIRPYRFVIPVSFFEIKSPGIFFSSRR